MAQSAVSISSNALILLGGNTISSFTDGDTGALLAANLYQGTYEAMLTETLWHFATKTVNLARLIDTPDNGYSYKFQLPPECLYMVTTDTSNFEIYEREVYSNSETLQVEMIYKVDEVNLPVYFVKALEYNLASLFAIPLTGNSSRADYYRQLYELELKKAKRADASQRPPKTLGTDRYVTVRN